jgi:hypothetical protein
MKASNERGETLADSKYKSVILSRYDLAYRNEFQYWGDFDRYYKLYESYVNESKSIWSTKIFIPLVFSYIERFLPKLVSNKPTVNFMARRPDTVEKAQKMQALFEWQWDQVARLKEGGMPLELIKFCKEALITGTAIAKVPWVLEMDDRKSFDEKGNVVVKKQKLFDGPSFEIIDPYDFFFDPEAYDIQRASWVMHRTRKTLDEMKAVNEAKGVEIYKNLDQIKPTMSGSLSSGDYDFKLRRKTSLGSSQMIVQDDTTDKVELWEMWGLFPKIDKDGEEVPNSYEEKVVVLANKNVIVRDIPYPYWHGKKPFIKFTPFPRDFEFYGVPIIKHMERLQFYTNEFVSQKFDNQMINLNQMIVVDPAANLEDWQLVWRPGGVIRARPEFIKPLPLGDVTAPIDTSVNYLSTQMQIATGISDFYSNGVGGNGSENKTATGANLINQQMQTRSSMITAIFEEQVIKEIGSQWHGLDGQFIKIPMVVRVIGPDGKANFPLILPDDMRASYDVMPEAGSSQSPNEALDRQQFIQALQLIGSNPIMAQQTDWQSVEKEIWRRFKIKEGDKLMISTAGSQPQQMPGEGEMPGGQNPAQPNGMQPDAQMLSEAAMGRGMPTGSNPVGRPPLVGPPGSEESPEEKKPGTISTKFADLTINEQKQWLAQLGIQADVLTRTENMSQSVQKEKADRAMEMMKSFKSTNPVNIGE